MKPFIFVIAVGITIVYTSCSTSQQERITASSATSKTSQIFQNPEDEQRFNATYLESVRQRLKGNSDAQYELLAEALRINPESAEANYEMGTLIMNKSSVTDSISRKHAEDLLLHATHLSEANTYYKTTLADIYARQGRLDEAITIYEELVSRRPVSEWYATLTQLYELKGDFAAAATALDRFENIEGCSEGTAIGKYQFYIQAGNQEKAFESIEKLCATYPNDLRYRVLMGDMYAQGDHNSMALATYNDVLTLEPDNGYAQMSLLAYYKRNGQERLYNTLLRQLLHNSQAPTHIKVEAMRAFATDNIQYGGDSSIVLQLFDEVLAEPQSDRSMIELCAQYVSTLGMEGEALRPLMLRILEIEPDYSKARLTLLGLDLKRQDEEAVLENCRMGRLYDPAQAVYSYYEALVLYKQDRIEEALATVNDGALHIDASTDREVASDLFTLQGDMLHQLGRDNEAYSAYDSALTYNPANILCANNYAYFLSLEGRDLDKAEEMSKITVEAEPDNATYLDTYAWVLYVSGQYAKALMYIDQTLKYSTDEPSATLLEHAGDIYYKNNKKKEALNFWKQALKVCNDAEQTRRLARKIKRRRL